MNQKLNNMLTPEELKSIDGLNDAQIEGITKLSKNKGDAEISKVRNSYVGVLGFDREKDEPDNKFSARIQAKFAKVVDNPELSQELAAARQEVATLKSQLEKNPDSSKLMRELADAKGLVDQLKAKDLEWTEKEKEWVAKSTKNDFDYAKKSVFSEINLKKEIPASAAKMIIQAASGVVDSFGAPEKQADGTYIFRDKNGEIMRNPNNKFEPYTIKDVLEETLKDSLDTGIVQQGTGSQSRHSTATGYESTIATAKTQVEMDDAIDTYLLAQGLSKDDEQFETKAIELRKKHNFDKKPLQ